MSGDVEKNDIWTPPKLVSWISDSFKKRGLPQPHRLEAEILVCHALNISRLDIYLQYDKPCTEEEQEVLRSLVRRRFQREPLAYILESSKFWTLDLHVGSGVLIPRQDTEVVVETALKVIQASNNSRPHSVLEFGTGSGAISIALATECNDLLIVAVDSSTTALKYARNNLVRYQDKISANGNRLFFLGCDRFDAIKNRSHFDMIISNPPYIPSNDIADLQAEISQWEPKDALDGGKDGFDYYRILKDAAETFLKQNGSLVMEHGHNQKASIHDHMSKSDSLKLTDCIKDYAGHDRVIVYQQTRTY